MARACLPVTERSSRRLLVHHVLGVCRWNGSVSTWRRGRVPRMAQLVARKPRLVADTAARVRVMGDNQPAERTGSELADTDRRVVLRTAPILAPRTYMRE